MWSKDTNFIKWHLGGEDSSHVILAVAQLLTEPGSQWLTNATDDPSPVGRCLPMCKHTSRASFVFLCD